jgi:HRDC domain
MVITDDALFEVFREWRVGVAGRKKLPVWRLLSNRILREIARERPSRWSELEKVFGMGPCRMNTYGVEILEILEKYSAHGKAPIVKAAPRKYSLAETLKKELTDPRGFQITDTLVKSLCELRPESVSDLEALIPAKTGMNEVIVRLHGDRILQIVGRYSNV